MKCPLCRERIVWDSSYSSFAAMVRIVASCKGLLNCRWAQKWNVGIQEIVKEGGEGPWLRRQLSGFQGQYMVFE